MKQKTINKKYWKNRNGEYIKITGMSDEYIRNCIRTSEERVKNIKKKNKVLKNELKKRERNTFIKCIIESVSF